MAQASTKITGRLQGRTERFCPQSGRNLQDDGRGRALFHRRNDAGKPAIERGEHHVRIRAGSVSDYDRDVGVPCVPALLAQQPVAPVVAQAVVDEAGSDDLRRLVGELSAKTGRQMAAQKIRCPLGIIERARNRESGAFRGTVRSALLLAATAVRFAKKEDGARMVVRVEASRPGIRCGKRWPEYRFTPAGTRKELPAYGFGKGQREIYALFAARVRAAFHSATVRIIYTRRNSFRDPQFAEGRTAPGESAAAPGHFLRRGSQRAPA